MTDKEFGEEVKAEMSVHHIMSAVSDLLILKCTPEGRHILAVNAEDLKLTYSVLGNLLDGIGQKEAA